jgi:hypothetical protein
MLNESCVVSHQVKSANPTQLDYAELICALWRLGSSKDRMPTGNGIFDRILQDALPMLPERFRHGLTFCPTDVGIRCVELPDILRTAEDALITKCHGLTTEVKLSEDTAREIVLSFGLSVQQAHAIGVYMISFEHAIQI